MTALSELYDKTLKEIQKEEISRLKDIGIGLVASGLYLLAIGLVVYVVMVA